MYDFFKFEPDGNRRYYVIGEADDLCYGYVFRGVVCWVYINEHAQAFPDVAKLEEILSFMKSLDSSQTTGSEPS